MPSILFLVISFSKISFNLLSKLIVFFGASFDLEAKKDGTSKYFDITLVNLGMEL